MSDPAFFGYGSLVNLATHDYADPKPATLRGWRRVWRGTKLRNLAFLSVTQTGSGALLGIVAKVPAADWAALDRREAAYHRRDITDHIRYNGAPTETALYQVTDEFALPDERQPILLSYLHVVVQGYLQIYGRKGAQHFFETTDGWDRPIMDDLSNPIYPRHQKLSAEEIAIVDKYLAAVVQDAE